jgi:hypothetical protein
LLTEDLDIESKMTGARVQSMINQPI